MGIVESSNRNQETVGTGKTYFQVFDSTLLVSVSLLQGNFGVVYEATLTRPNQPPKEVAAKKLDIVSPSEAKFEAARTEMLEEARIMRLVTGHQNIVGAIGVTIDVEQPVAVMELVRGKRFQSNRPVGIKISFDLGGSLERVLRMEKIPMDTKLRLCYEAAAGVKYIHSKGKHIELVSPRKVTIPLSGILHRDLAARNCLIERQMNGRPGCLKITDFGMARVFSGGKIFYKAVTVTQVPVAWSALESLEEFVWTVESDVWSLGVLIWEVNAVFIVSILKASSDFVCRYFLTAVRPTTTLRCSTE